MRKTFEEIGSSASSANRGRFPVTVSSCRCNTRACQLTLVLISLFAARPCNATVSYQLSLKQPSQHLFQVTMNVPDVHGKLTIQMPAWNALYEIRDFSSRIQRVEAFSGSQRLPIEQLDKLTWRIRHGGLCAVHD